MLEIQGTGEEARLLKVEQLIKSILRRLQALADKLGAQAEQQSPSGGYGGANDFWGQVITASIGSRAGPTQGGGTVRRQVVINGVFYNKTDGTAGHYTDEAVASGIAAAIPVKTYVLYKPIGGTLTIYSGDCTPAANYSADDTTAPPSS